MADGWRMDGGCTIHKNMSIKDLPLLQGEYRIRYGRWMSDKRYINEVTRESNEVSHKTRKAGD